MHRSRFLAALLALLLAPLAAAADTLNVCEDRDGDGRFGLVEVTLDPVLGRSEVLRPNLGTYQTCRQEIRNTGACAGNGTLCICEDRDSDGRFGIVRHPFLSRGQRVVEANVGNYFSCLDRMQAYGDTATRYHSCEDLDSDGRYGIVEHQLIPQIAPAQILEANYGNYYACTQRIAAHSQCQGNSYCACVDANQDGRFGVVWVNSQLVRSRVVQPNIGLYSACFPRMNWSTEWVN